MELVECVPNFSEGRRKEVIGAVAAEVRSANAKLLDVHSDPDHNRSVLTFVGSPSVVKEAAMAVGRKAIELIDLNQHRGAHPRIGALDVVPFVPLVNVTMAECAQIAREFAQEYASRFNVPVFLYEEAALRADRRNLADLRSGGFEELRETFGKDPDRLPDFGPTAIHPTAGATAVGARRILIAYNVNLATSDLSIAKDIARQVRERDGGLKGVRALAFELKSRGIVQVSMNITNHEECSMSKAFETVRSLAKQHRVDVRGSELVGLVPMDALADVSQFYLRLEGFDRSKVLERRLIYDVADRMASMDLASFSEAVASDSPTPGGGGVVAYAASLAAGLLSMVSRITLKRLEGEKDRLKVQEMLSESDSTRRRLLDLMDEDARSFESLMAAYRLPKQTDGEKSARAAKIQEGLKASTEAPLAIADAAAHVLNLGSLLAELAGSTILSDVEVAVHLGYASYLGALANVKVNLGNLKDEGYVKEVNRRVSVLESAMAKDKLESLHRLSDRYGKSG